MPRGRRTMEVGEGGEKKQQPKPKPAPKQAMLNFFGSMFKGNIGVAVKRALKTERIKRKVILAGFTDELQPQDQTDNKSVMGSM